MVTETKVIISGDAGGAIGAVKRLGSELGALQSLASKALNFSVLGGAASIAGLATLTKHIVDTGDQLNKMSQKTGIAVEDLSKLQYAAELSGVSTEALQKGLTNLSVGLIELAAGGAGESAAQLKKLGIEARNTDKTLKSSRQVLGELADQFAVMPDGVEKTAAAAAIFGKRMGAELIPLLNGGSAGLKDLGDEAERLGIVMTAELAKKSEEFNDNLSRLQKLSTAAGISIANALIPSLNALATEYLDAKTAGLGFFDSLTGIGLSDPSKGPAAQIARITAEIDKLKKKQAEGGSLLFGNIDEEIAKQEKLRKYFELQQKRQTGDSVESAETLAAKRVAIEKQMQATIAKLAQLRAIAEGKVSADILDDDTKRTAEQIKNAKALQQALTDAWKNSIKAAADAGDAAKKLFQQAADVRQNAADKAADKVRSTLTPEEQQQEINREFASAQQSAQSALASAQQSKDLSSLADANKRTESAKKLAEQANEEADKAQKAAERASKFAEQIVNPEDPTAGARAIQQAAEIKAKALEVQGQGKLKEKKDLEEQAASQLDKIKELDAQLNELETKAAALKVDADISAAQGALVTLQAQLDNLKDKTVTVTVNQVGAVPASDGSAAPAAAPGSFARGGYTGPGGKWQPAGIVHAGEFVLRREVVGQRGAIEFLSRFNRLGVSALQGYANGGLVRNIRIPSISAAPPAPASNATFNFPGMGSFPAHLAPDVLGELQTAFAREALKYGGRR